MKVATFLLCLFALGSTLMADETPDYKVLLRDGKFEVRDYPALKLVRTASDDGDFMRLFRYISGGNEADKKIPMTVPVLIAHEGDKSGMSFIMPRELAASGVPAPRDAALSVVGLPAGRFAVYRYSGGRDETNERSALAELQQWINHRRLEVTGTPLYGYYNAPWVPTFLRRNEVMLPIAGTQP